MGLLGLDNGRLNNKVVHGRGFGNGDGETALWQVVLAVIRFVGGWLRRRNGKESVSGGDRRVRLNYRVQVSVSNYWRMLSCAEGREWIRERM